MMTPDFAEVNQDGGDSDPIGPCLDAISNHAWVLQLDNWNVSSSTDAMLMRRVFTRLYNHGTFVVSSGNVPCETYNSTIVQTKKYKSTQELLHKRVFSVEV